MPAIAERTPQDVLDNTAIDKLLRLPAIGYSEEVLLGIIKGTTISLSLARAFVAEFDGEFIFSNGEKRIISHRGWV